MQKLISFNFPNLQAIRAGEGLEVSLAGADWAAADDEGVTALLAAAVTGNVALVERLLEFALCVVCRHVRRDDINAASERRF